MKVKKRKVRKNIGYGDPKFFLSPTQHKSACALHEGRASTGEREKNNKVPTAAQIESGMTGIDGQS